MSHKYTKVSTNSGKFGYEPDSRSNLSSYPTPPAEDHLLMEADSIRRSEKKIQWVNIPAAIVSRIESTLLEEFVNTSHPHTQDTMIQQNGATYFDIFLKLLKLRDEKHLRYILALLHEFIEGDKTRAQYFVEYVEQNPGSDPSLPLVTLLSQKSPFIQYMSAFIIGRLTMLMHYDMPNENKDLFFNWITTQFRIQTTEYLTSCATALQYLLRTDVYRYYYITKFSIKPLVDLLTSKIGLQLQYNLIFSIWMLSFNQDVCTKLVDKDHQIIIVLADILKASSKPKITRLIVATFRNLIEKPIDQKEKVKNAALMIQKKVHSQMDVLRNQEQDDDEMNEDVKFLHDALERCLQDITTFDQYASEVKSGALEWSPVHRNEKFWRENVEKLNGNRFELVYHLITYLQESRNTVTLAIAAHDLGQYVRYYPRGKAILDREGAKEMIIRLMQNSDPNLKMEALLSVQKMMVNNWEYLGKQVTEAVSK